MKGVFMVSEVCSNIQNPSPHEVEEYLDKWKKLPNFEEEEALIKLFEELCPENTDIRDILIKVATLNKFYSTNILNTRAVAKHIHKLNIDKRLKDGDPFLVNGDNDNSPSLGCLEKGHGIFTSSGKELSCYSFATKYCSFHNPDQYAMYDSYIAKVLSCFKKRDGFSSFTQEGLRDYPTFLRVLGEFEAFYGLDAYSLKKIDIYLWQLGKKYFQQ
jgi:hypothetical protein